MWLAKKRELETSQIQATQNQDLCTALKGTDEAIWIWHLDSQEIRNHGFESLVGGTFPDTINALEFIQVFIHLDDALGFQQAINNHLQGLTDTFEVSYRLRHYNRSWIWVTSRGQISGTDVNKNPTRIVATCKNIESNLHFESESRAALEVVRSMNEAVAVLDLQFDFISINPAFSRITGYIEQELIGENRNILNSDQYDRTHTATIQNQIIKNGRWAGELWQKRKDQGEFLSYIEVSEVMDRNGHRSHFVVVLNDITDKKRVEQELIHLANYDALTGLPGRPLLIESLSKAIIHARRNQNRVAVLFLDLDNFKNINDSLGHTAGDRLLVVVAQRLQAATNGIGLVARLSGDEFVILLETADTDIRIRECAMHVLAQFNNPILLGDNLSANLTGSIGVSIFPDHAQKPSDLLKYADIAMYQAKNEGRNTVQYFNEEMDAKSRHRAQLLGALKVALAGNEFELHFQPRMSLETDQIVSVEALLRWNSKEMGHVTPDIFIPLAEESGQIIEIGEWVLDEALRTLNKWHDLGLNHISMSINVSALQLLRPKLANQISALIDKYQIPQYCIELEITESMVLSQHTAPLANLWALKDLGVSLSLDDFGTGYSSLSYLKQLPIDTLKIDKSFVREIGPNVSDNTLVQTIIALGHSLGMTMIAEGVETFEHLVTLKEFGCDEIQGYWLAKPLSASDCLTFINEHEKTNKRSSPFGQLDSDAIAI